MGQKLNDSEAALYRAVDEVMHYLWDPIGVAGAPAARDEYYGYLPVVYGMLKQGSDETALANYLSEISTEGMGLSSDPQLHMKVARILVRWREAVGENAV
jgi:hypothetical protein